MATLALVPLVTDEADTEVVDPEAITMQVRIATEDGQHWHRWLSGSNGSETACGVVVDQRLTLGTRYEVCEGDLCPDCFTARELVKAALANAAARRK